MAEPDYLLNEPKRRVMLLGNEAIARGFLEGGIEAAAAYPGTPSTEIMETLINMSRRYDFYTEWSTNEKVAAEVAISASMSGLRAMVSMKAVGVNVASEPIMAFTYMGVEGGLVLVSADDPGPHSSHNEQDNRLFAMKAYMPVLEPCDVREARDMAKAALDCSERWCQPVMLRSNTTIGHTRSDVVLRRVPKRRKMGRFVRQPRRWVNLPMNARVLRAEIVERMEKIRKAAERFRFTTVEGSSGARTGIITSGISYVYIKEALRVLRLGKMKDLKLLKLGMPYPIPPRKVARFLKGLDRVLVVEELEPVVEMQAVSIANRADICVPIQGKGTGLVPLEGEMSTGKAVRVLARFLGLEVPKELEEGATKLARARELAPPRPPIFCAGCPERNGFYAMNVLERRLKKDRGEFVRPTDIGCYTLGYMSPLNAADTNLCMGAGIGVGVGFAHFVDSPVIATIGDSTFFHAGMPPLVNAVFNNADVTMLLFDNSTTAMTGHQPHPGMGKRAGGEKAPAIDIKRVVRALGVKHVKVVDAFDLEALVDALEAAVRYKGPAVVIAKGLCTLLHLRDCRIRGEKVRPYMVDQDKCKKCKVCIAKFGCPAMYWKGEDVEIDPLLCSGCGVCASKLVCAFKAIKPVPKKKSKKGKKKKKGGGR
jgi:indolepyruvate ferredoxin oxidoreductase alpha subunit